MFPDLSFICSFLEAAPKVSQSQAESHIFSSEPFPEMGGHPVPESGQTQHECFGSHHCTTRSFLCHALLYLSSFLFSTSVSSCRCNPSSGSRPDHHRSAAAHDQLSSQTCSSQAKESPTPHHRGVRLPHQWHVPVANQSGAANNKRNIGVVTRAWHKTFWIVTLYCSCPASSICPDSKLETSQLSVVMTVYEHAHTEPCWLVNLLLIDAAFKASDTFKCSWIHINVVLRKSDCESIMKESIVPPHSIPPMISGIYTVLLLFLKNLL